MLKSVEKTPTILNPTGWYKSDANPLGQNSFWLDSYGSLHAQQFSTGRQPVNTANVLGGNRRSMLFDGSDNYSLPAGNALVFGKSNCTIFALVKNNSAGITQRIWSSGTTANLLRGSLRVETDNTFSFGNNMSGSSANVVKSASAYTTTNFNILCGYMEGTTQGIIVNNGSATTNSNGSTVTDLNKAEIGATADGNSQRWAGHIAEVIFYNRKLTSDEITRIFRYLARFYGLPIS